MVHWQRWREQRGAEGANARRPHAVAGQREQQAEAEAATVEEMAARERWRKRRWRKRWQSQRVALAAAVDLPSLESPSLSAPSSVCSLVVHRCAVVDSENTCSR